MELRVKGHNDMCGGYGYSGHAIFSGQTVKDVLEEIKDYVKDKDAHYLGEGFGNPNSKNCDCWSISIDGDIYLSNWIESKWKTYYDKNQNTKKDKLVKDVKVDGGWYCYYNFNIITEEEN